MRKEFIQEENDTLRVVFNEEISRENARELRDDIDAKISEVKPSVLVLDLSKIEIIDSSALGLVVGRCMLMKELGGKVRVVATKAVIKLFKRDGVQKIARLEEV